MKGARILHLGKDETVRDREVVGIFDIEKATVSEDTKKFLSLMQKDYKAVNLATDLPAAFVLTDGEYTDRIYITSLSARVLKNRGSDSEERE